MSKTSKSSRVTKKEQRIMTILLIIVSAVLVALILFLVLRNFGVLPNMITSATVGEHKLSATEFTYFYVDAITDTYDTWSDSYGDGLQVYLLMQNLDISLPLSSQIYDGTTGKTWADYFVDVAIENAVGTYALADAAGSADFVLDTDELEELDRAMTQLSEYAQYCGYTSLDKFLKDKYGNGASEDSFRAYQETIALASAYQSHYNDSLTYTEDQLRAYETEHTAEFQVYSYRTYYVASSAFLKGSADENGNTVYTEESKAQSLQDAMDTAQGLLGADSAEALDAAIAKLDLYGTGTAASTIYKDIVYNDVGAPLQDWVCDLDRVSGDMTLLPAESTSYYPDGTTSSSIHGYYVLFFEGAEEDSSIDKNALITQHLRLHDLSKWYISLISGISVQQKSLFQIPLDYIIATDYS